MCTLSATRPGSISSCSRVVPALARSIARQDHKEGSQGEGNAADHNRDINPGANHRTRLNAAGPLASGEGRGTVSPLHLESARPAAQALHLAK